MPRKRALIGVQVGSGQQVPRNKFGDKPGFYPERTPNPAVSTVNVVAQVLRNGTQGMSVTNWQAFGAKGGTSKVEQGKRKRKPKAMRSTKMRLHGAPGQRTETKHGHFDKRSGRMVHKHQAPVTTVALSYDDLVRMSLNKKNDKPIKLYVKAARKGNV